MLRKEQGVYCDFQRDVTVSVFLQLPYTINVNSLMTERRLCQMKTVFYVTALYVVNVMVLPKQCSIYFTIVSSIQNVPGHRFMGRKNQYKISSES